MDTVLRLLVILMSVLVCAVQAAETPAALIQRGQDAMARDPEAGRRLAEQALRALATTPDPDLQVRAHLQLCDYYSERSVEAARREIALARALLPKAKRQGLHAGLLACEGELHQYAGDNVQAMALYQQAATAARLPTMRKCWPRRYMSAAICAACRANWPPDSPICGVRSPATSACKCRSRCRPQ